MYNGYRYNAHQGISGNEDIIPSYSQEERNQRALIGEGEIKPEPRWRRDQIIKKAVVPIVIKNVLSKEAMELWIPLRRKDYAMDRDPLRQNPSQDPTWIPDRENVRYFGIPIFWMVWSVLVQGRRRIGRNWNWVIPRTITSSWINHELWILPASSIPVLWTTVQHITHLQTCTDDKKSRFKVFDDAIQEQFHENYDEATFAG